MNEKNELKEYIESNLTSRFDKFITIKDTEKSKIFIFRHRESGNLILERISTNRNDEVFRLLKNKSHSNLVDILEVCSDENHLIVLEKFIVGKSLLKLIDIGSINSKQACRYAYQICDALSFLHNNGIIHRDIKPSNIIIDNNGNAVLLDLSIARMISEKEEKDTATLGTIGYAAPEQFGLSQSTKATDIYSLGVLLNIMITGVHPTISIPKGKICRVIKKATATQISERYQNAEQMKKALKNFI